MTIAIDGPAGAGKSTLARLLADALGFIYLDSGAMYRCVGLLARRAGVAMDDFEGLTALAEGAEIAFDPGRVGEPQRVLLFGEDVSAAIRTPEGSKLASQVAVVPGVRRAMVARQRVLGQAGNVVMEGRDIGTVVFPDAALKIFLTATPDERARRRLSDLRARGDAGATHESVLADLAERDARDASREMSPLLAAADAVTILTDGLTPSELLARLVALARERGA